MPKGVRPFRLQGGQRAPPLRLASSQRAATQAAPGSVTRAQLDRRPLAWISRRWAAAWRAAVSASFDRVFLTLLDTHVAALISAAFLFNFGTGPIRGFAVTLAVGLLSNLFTATFVSKTLFEMALSSRRQVATLSI